MEDAKRQKRPGRPPGPRKQSPDLKVVAVNCNPAPDAQERLRRLFTLLVKHANRERLAACDDNDASSDDHTEDES